MSGFVVKQLLVAFYKMRWTFCFGCCVFSKLSKCYCNQRYHVHYFVEAKARHRTTSKLMAESGYKRLMVVESGYKRLITFLMETLSPPLLFEVV